MRSENTCGCGLHRSPEMALTASTNSDPRSYNTLLTSPTAWFSLIPGFIARYNSSYAASTIAAEWFSSEISSCVLITRASLITCCPSTTLMPSFSSANKIGGSTTSTPNGSLCSPRFSSSTLIFRATHFRRHRSAQQRNSGTRTLTKPWTILLVMPRRAPEVPQNRFVILRQQSEPADLVLRPRSNVRCRDIPHVVHVKTQQRTHLRFPEQRLRARQPLAPQPVKINAVLPVHRHRPIRFQRHFTPPVARSALTAHRPRRLENRLFGRHRHILERRRKWNRHVHRAHALHRCIQAIKRAFRNHRRNLPGHAVPPVSFIHHDGP